MNKYNFHAESPQTCYIVFSIANNYAKNQQTIELMGS